MEITLAAAPPVILASKSAARAQLLRAAGVPFTQAEALVDEAAAREALQAEAVPVEEAAIALAGLKAAFVARQAPEPAIVVGADQLLELEGAWLEKPKDAAAARAQLAALRGRRHRLVSGVVAFRGNSRIWQHVDVARLWVRNCSDAFLDRYVAAAGPDILACVGAYQLEGLGAQLMARVEGDWFTILGLPLLPLLQFLRDQGVLLR
ncbi:Maf family protein [Benzoatithermus flavus]|uniref:Nucleoside triphosphate pyrophosphatase n=1 Tax=Benzoatithermus flavus TaxID=3108223 RepID=A0ABU8XNQ8_9PROT